MVTLLVDFVVFLLVEARGYMVMYMLDKELSIACYEIISTTITCGVKKENQNVWVVSMEDFGAYCN